MIRFLTLDASGKRKDGGQIADLDEQTHGIPQELFLDAVINQLVLSEKIEIAQFFHNQ